MNKRVLLTGASGFIGRHTLSELADLGYEIHAIVNRRDITAGLTCHKADILNAAEADKVISQVKPSHLLHLAWYAVPGKYQTSEVNRDWVKASLELLDSFRNHGGERVVMAGTCFEYSWDEGPCDEYGTSLNPTTFYGECKKELGEQLGERSGEAGISSAWGRIFHLYGKHEAEGRLVPAVIRSILKGEEAKCTHGAQLRDFMYVEDTAAALVRLLDSDVEGPVNIASGQPVTIAELAEKIADMLDRSDLLKLGAYPASESDPAEITAVTKRLYDEVGWQNRYDLDSGLENTIAWYRGKIGGGY